MNLSPISLAITRLGQVYDPRIDLFGAGEVGVWYDPSDLSTMFQDAAGTVPVTGVEQPVGMIRDKSGNGNHATQPTATSRPVLSARYNLLTYSEDFSKPDWIKHAGVTIQGKKIVEIAGYSGFHRVYRLDVNASVGTAYKAFFRIKAAGRNFASLRLQHGVQNHGVIIDLTTGDTYEGRYDGTIPMQPLSNLSVSQASDGYWEVSGEFIASATLIYPFIYIADSPTTTAYTGDGVSGVLSDGMDIRFANLPASLPPYQRVNTATDYDADPAKFPAFRRLDGVDDSLASSTGGGGTTGFFFSAVISPHGSAGTARTLFSDAGANTGYIVRINASNQLELSAGNGTAYTTIATAGALNVGDTDVVQAWDDGTTLNVKIGSGPTASIARPVVVAGTAGYTLYKDNGASTGYFNGLSYGEIYRKDSGLTQSQREAVAVYQRKQARIA